MNHDTLLRTLETIADDLSRTVKLHDDSQTTVYSLGHTVKAEIAALRRLIEQLRKEAAQNETTFAAILSSMGTSVPLSDTAVDIAQTIAAAPPGTSSGLRGRTTWQPIETAPKDNKRLLYLARIDEAGQLQGLDFDAQWLPESESWEQPEVYWIWATAHNTVEEPTHWAYQDEPLPMMPPSDRLVQHFCNALDNLNDLPVSADWASLWTKTAEELLAIHRRNLLAGPKWDREALGRLVRDEWMDWAREQPNPKPSWLVPWEGLSEPDKEVDRRIGERLAKATLTHLFPDMRAALEEARTGLLWYHEEFPDTVSETDHEALARINAALGRPPEDRSS